MSIKYFEINGPFDPIVRRVEGDVVTDIPMKEENSDYQRFLVWLAEGNTPEPWNPEA